MKKDRMASKALELAGSRMLSGAKGSGGCDGQTWKQKRDRC